MGIKKIKHSAFILVFMCLGLAPLIAEQEPNQAVELSVQEIEALFLANNLQLVAQRFEIDMAEAEIIQAKLWDNPTLSISDVNLWTTQSQRSGEPEAIPPVFGRFARNTQFSVELSQLIQTANKRGKLVRQQRVAKDIASRQFEELLRDLKVELRRLVAQLEFVQAYIGTLHRQQTSVQQLVNSYRKLVDQGNIARGELIRLQAQSLDISSQLVELQTEANELQSSLRSLTHMPPHTHISIAPTPLPMVAPHGLLLGTLYEQAQKYRPDLHKAKLQSLYQSRAIAYQKAQRIPDVTFSANYDRAGGVWSNFIGIGISVDIPLLNRNQGGIKAAKISKQQSDVEVRYQLSNLEQEVNRAYNNYASAYLLYEKVHADNLPSQMERMLDIYTKNLMNRNISMLEYIDFVDTYRSTMQTVLNAKKQVNIQFEELQYTVGQVIQ